MRPTPLGECPSGNSHEGTPYGQCSEVKPEFVRSPGDCAPNVRVQHQDVLGHADKMQVALIGFAQYFFMLHSDVVHRRKRAAFSAVGMKEHEADEQYRNALLDEKDFVFMKSVNDAARSSPNSVTSSRRIRARARVAAEAEDEVLLEASCRVTALVLVLLSRAPVSLLPRSTTRRQPLRVGHRPRHQQRARVPPPARAVVEGRGSELDGAVQFC